MFRQLLWVMACIAVAGQKAGKNGGIIAIDGKGTMAMSPPAPKATTSTGDMATPKQIEGISHQQSAAASEALLDKDDAVMLFLDHQTGLFQTVKDVPLPVLRANTVALAKMGVMANIPIFLTASEPNGPNGPLMEEFSIWAPNATYIARKGEISAWDNEDFFKAVEASGKKTLIMSGVWTSVCVAFPALQAKLDGFKVYAVFDASGDMSEMASHITLARLTQAGVIPVTTNVILAELQRTWNRPDAMKWGEMYGELVPNYRAAVESFSRAQDVATGKAPTMAMGNNMGATGNNGAANGKASSMVMGGKSTPTPKR
jgi:nicotinamidase-related amidase